MSCEICHHNPGRAGTFTCSPECEALRCMGMVQQQSDAIYPGTQWAADERAQLLWDIKQRWHEVRGLPFTEEPPKTAAMLELERLELLRTA